MAGVKVGVDLGGTKVQTAVVRDEQVIGSHRVLTPHTGALAVVDSIIEAVDAALTEAGATRAEVEAVGIGSPGIIDTATGRVSGAPNIPGFHESFDLGPRVAAALGGVPVRLENDVNVGMLGEHKRGSGRAYDNVIGVFCGTGVGGGLILDGELFDGRGGAGEIGHMIVKPGGRMCGCGLRGHLEAYAGRSCMEARAHRLVERGRRTTLFHIMEKKGRDRLSSGVIAAGLEDKDPVARELVDDAVWALGAALASMQNLLDLEAIIIGGGLGDRLGQPFVDRISATVLPLLFAPTRPPAILPTALGDLSGAVGAAVLVGG